MTSRRSLFNWLVGKKDFPPGDCELRQGGRAVSPSRPRIYQGVLFGGDWRAPGAFPNGLSGQTRVQIGAQCQGPTHRHSSENDLGAVYPAKPNSQVPPVDSFMDPGTKPGSSVFQTGFPRESPGRCCGSFQVDFREAGGPGFQVANAATRFLGFGFTQVKNNPVPGGQIRIFGGQLEAIAATGTRANQFTDINTLAFGNLPRTSCWWLTPRETLEKTPGKTPVANRGFPPRARTEKCRLSIVQALSCRHRLSWQHTRAP